MIRPLQMVLSVVGHLMGKRLLCDFHRNPESDALELIPQALKRAMQMQDGSVGVKADHAHAVSFYSLDAPISRAEVARLIARRRRETSRCTSLA